MKNYLVMGLLVSCFLNYGQNVGINTTTPEATLDINGNVMIDSIPRAEATATYEYLVMDPTTQEIQKVNGNFSLNTSIAKAVSSAGITLLGTSLFGGWQQINFTVANVAINNGAFNATTDVYTVPSNGIYEFTYYIRYGTGLQAALLGGTVKIGLLRQTVANVNSVLDERTFAGANLALLVNITISSSEINSGCTECR